MSLHLKKLLVFTFVTLTGCFFSFPSYIHIDGGIGDVCIFFPSISPHPSMLLRTLRCTTKISTLLPHVSCSDFTVEKDW